MNKLGVKLMMSKILQCKLDKKLLNKEMLTFNKKQKQSHHDKLKLLNIYY